MQLGQNTWWIKSRTPGTYTIKKRYENMFTSSGKPLYKQFSGKTKTEAYNKMLKYEEENLIPGRNLSDKSNKSLYEFMLMWFKLIKINQLKPNSRDAMYYTIEYRIKKHKISSYKLSSLNCMVLQEYINSLKEEGYAKATIVKTFQTLNNCLNYAVNADIIPKNPIVNVVIPKGDEFNNPSKEKVILSEDEKNRLKDVLLSRHGKEMHLVYCYGPELLFMLYSGIRIGELLALTWEDIDMKNKKISINKTRSDISCRNMMDDYGIGKEIKNSLIKHIASPKTSSSVRIIGIPDICIDILESIKQKQGENYTGSGLIVLSKNGKPAERRNISRCLVSALNRAHINKHMSSHNLRHSYASSLLNSYGANIQEVSRALGHLKVSTTLDVYCHTTEVSSADFMNKVNML